MNGGKKQNKTQREISFHLTIFCGNINEVKFTLNTFKDNTFNNYDVVAVFSSHEENCNMQIYVVEDKIKWTQRNMQF